MKKLASVLLLFLALIPLTSCAPKNEDEKILAHLTLPFQANCTFVINGFSGSGRLNVTEESFNLGVTDGELKGLVVSVGEGGARFLYEGLDISFSSVMTKTLLNAREVFPFLKAQSFSKQNAVITATTSEYIFSDERFTVRYLVDTESGAPCALKLDDGKSAIEFQFSTPQGDV